MTSRHHDYRFQVLNKERGRRFVAIRDRSCPFVSVRARSLISDTGFDRSSDLVIICK